ncbi:T9SS type A sorting domain-containing protein [Rufibacter roseus]|uniref:T9SS type A sorting domain-containing protein n=1 Tax=Rufibacter roseus TaxID=1567108 RepID=A0ABW2DNP2_9BACT|nr:T9SS type A sorting domain-containing protein [Rufibacter roseus]
MVQLFIRQKNSQYPIINNLLFWVFALLASHQLQAQTNLAYPGGEYRTTSTGTVGQSAGTASLEKLTTDGTWAPASYPLPSDATLHIAHSTHITGTLTLANLNVASERVLTVASTGQLTTSNRLTVAPSAELKQVGAVESLGLLQLQANSKLWIQSSSYHANSTLWSGVEEIDIDSEVQVEQAAANSVLFNPANLTQQAYGYAFGKLTVTPGTTSSQWQLLNASSNLAYAATLQTAGTSSITVAGGNTTVAFGQSLHFAGGSFFVQNQSSGTSTLTVAGNLTLQNTFLTLNQTSSSAAITYIDLQGNLHTNSTSTITNSSTVSTSTSGIRLNGTSWQELQVAGPINHVSVAVKTGAMARLKQNLVLNPSNSVYAGTFTVENGSTLDFGTDASGVGHTISGQGYFRLDQGGTLYVTSAQGINATGATGNVQVSDSRRTFNQVATFVYNAQVPQLTGNAFTTTSNGKIIIIDNPTSVTITHSTGITSNTALSAQGGRLEIRQGRLIGTATADISSSGRLVMSGGVYQIGMLNTTVPLLTGTYELTGGSIELAGDGEQTLRGKTYHSVTVGGSNAGGTAKTISTTTTINQNLTILPNATFDVANKTLRGDGGLTMTGGLFRIGKASGTLPELTGKTEGYILTGGTIELYGTVNGQSQSIRGTFGTSQKIVYHQLLLSAAQANTLNELGNHLLSGNFDVAGTLTVQSPAVLQIASNRAIGGSGNFILSPGATLLYGSAQGIKLSGTGTSDGNIRVSGNRSFSPQANYGFIGNSEMVTGDGLPAQVANLLVAKPALGVTLTNSVTVTGTFTYKSGVFKTEAQELFLANASSSSLLLADQSLYVQGNLRRAVGSSGSYSFPVGTANGKRQLDLNSNGLSGNGFNSIAVSFMPLTNHQDRDLNVIENGYRYLQVVPEGVWHVSPNAQPSEGSYTAMASLQGFMNLTDNQFALLIRPLTSVSGKDWTTGNGVLDAPNKEGRTVESGFAKRNFVGQFGQMGIATMEATLPVSWLYVKAEPTTQGVEVKWATSIELNNERFEVEYSFDGKTFATAGVVTGKGSTTIAQHYTFRHTFSASQAVYYRVKQIDYDGKFDYSKTVVAKPTTSTLPAMSLYPNPSQDLLFLTGVAPAASVEIFNMQGKMVEKAAVLAEESTPYIQVRHLPAGQYILQIRHEGSIHRLRFVK